MELQTTIFQRQCQNAACAFTGHRDIPFDFPAEKLYDTVETLIKNGVTHFYNGAAQGFDMLAAETVAFLKRKYKHIKLIICAPFYGQEKYFSVEEKSRYKAIIKNADELVYVSERYYKGCYLKRDRYMADRADILVAYKKKTTGGTAYTVGYFSKKYPEKEILFL